MNCGSSSVDRALAFQAEGRGFESRLPLSNERDSDLSVRISFFCNSISNVYNFISKNHDILMRYSKINISLNLNKIQ